MKTQITFRGRKSFPEGTIRDYGKYGRYQKKDKKWVRLKSGYPTFRKTIEYNKMKAFLKAIGYNQKFFSTRGVKDLRALINSRTDLKEEYYGKSGSTWL